MNPALVEFAGTLSVAGTVTAALLLARLTDTPPAGAAAESATEHASDPAPVIEEAVHEIPVRVGVDVFNCRRAVADPPFALAVRVTLAGAVTVAMFAVNDALDAFFATVTDDGTDTDELLLVRLTTTPPGELPLRLTVQLSCPAPVMEYDEHVTLAGTNGANRPRSRLNEFWSTPRFPRTLEASTPGSGSRPAIVPGEEVSSPLTEAVWWAVPAGGAFAAAECGSVADAPLAIVDVGFATELGRNIASSVVG